MIKQIVLALAAILTLSCDSHTASVQSDRKISAATAGTPCSAQEDCDTGLYCHIPPRCEEGGCDGVCETTDPAGDGEVCNAYRSCDTGLVCCYPCGIPGCESRCTVPCSAGTPGCFGGCFLFP